MIVIRAMTSVALGLIGAVIAMATGIAGAVSLVIGHPLMFASRPASLAEAARYEDAAEIVLRLSFGEGINQPALVRHTFPDAGPLMLTPLEAAVASEAVGVVQLLLDRGARVDRATSVRLRCFAERHRLGGEIQEYLTMLDASPLDCTGVPLPE